MKIKVSEEYRKLVPRPIPEDYLRLEESIKGEGVRDAIIVNLQGVILDGYTRYEIALKYDKEIGTIERSFENKFDEREFIIKANLERRHLNQYQRAILGEGLLKIEKERARERQQEARHKRGIVKEKFPELKPAIEGQSRDLAAKAVGISGKQLERVIEIEKEATDEQKDDLIYGRKSVNKVYADIKREERLDEQEKGRQASALPEGKFNVIYADVPWKYNNQIEKWGSVSLHYKDMAMEEIYNVEIPSAENAVLFLWVTNPMLLEGLKLSKEWGFEYKTNMVWVKTNLKKPGSGFYIRGRHELLFICTKGSFLPDQRGKKPMGSVIEADVGEHSEKPEIAYEIIESMYPGAKYLELFARKKRKGWTSWGDEAI